MNMQNIDHRNLAKRTKNFALRIIRLYAVLPQSHEAQIIGKQMLRSGTSVGANYREGMRSRSKAEFISKISISLQELEETSYWLELLIEAEIIKAERLNNLLEETNELIAIFVSSINKAKKNNSS